MTKPREILHEEGGKDENFALLSGTVPAIEKAMNRYAELKAAEFAEWTQPLYRYNRAVKEWQHRNTLKIYTTSELYSLFENKPV